MRIKKLNIQFFFQTIETSGLMFIVELVPIENVCFV